MLQRTFLLLLMSGVLSSPVCAQETGFDPPHSLLNAAQTVLFFLGMVFVGYRTYGAFDSPPVALGDGPAPPRYMTQPRQYRLGVIVYVAICLLIYALAIYFYKQLLPIVGGIAPELLQKLIENSTKEGSLSFPLVIIFAAGVLFVLLKNEADWNPLFMLRRLVWGWASIPHFANAIMGAARDDLVVPNEARANVAGNLDTPNVDIGDFDKERHSLDRNWAELCYIRLWLDQNRADGSHYTFFNEPSFSWNKLEADYERARNLVAPLKKALNGSNGAEQNIFADVAATIETLRCQYCRLAACFIVYKNDTRKDAVRDAKQFGARISENTSRANPLRYIVIFVVAIAIAIYLGVWLSAITWDLLRSSPDSAFIQDPDLVTRWTGYSLASYGMPILVVLLLRYLGWTNDPDQPTSYLISYATVFLVALGVSVICLSLAIQFAGTSQAATKPFLELVFTEVKWCFSPAVVSVYVAYHVDRQIDPMLPDIGSYGAHWRLPQRLMSCVLFGLLVTAFSLMPSLSLSASSVSAWPVDKLRAVVIGTIFIIGLITALASEFCLIKPMKPKPATDQRSYATA